MLLVSDKSPNTAFQKEQKRTQYNGFKKRQSADAIKEARKSEYFAKLRNVPSSPRKMRLVVDMIRGQEAFKALGILKFSNKEASERLRSFSAPQLPTGSRKPSARQRPSDLYVKTVFVDCAPMLKRLRPAPQGRGYRIRKRSNHVTLFVDTINNEKLKSGKMGQKVNPISNRLGVIRGWDSNWYGGKKYGETLLEDSKIRKYLRTRLAKASVSRIIIERTLKMVTVTICTSRPGVIIGKGGQEVDTLKEEFSRSLPTRMSGSTSTKSSVLSLMPR